jgi:hypothetical protein
MKKSRKIVLTMSALTIIGVLSVFGWFVSHVFEGERPLVDARPLKTFLSEKQTFTVEATDQKRGLRSLSVTIDQSGRKIQVLKREFPFQGLLNNGGTHHHKEDFSIDPRALNLAQGQAELLITVFDHSRRGGGDGNRSLFSHTITVDTIAPSIRGLSRLHYINQGGACLVVYQTSSDTKESGIYVGDLFFPGFLVEEGNRKGIHTCYFAAPYDIKKDTTVKLWAEDRAGNSTRSSLYHRIRRKRFRKDRLEITDGFLEHILPYFSFQTFDPGDSPIDKYLKINNDMRKENHRILTKLQEESSTKRLWKGGWLRLDNAATMARFADHRTYFYNGEKVDEKDHMGVDLASLANAPVPAANNGRVIYAGRLGIYGEAVVIDHGQRLTSLYGHLSSIQVEKGRDVKKGDIIGITGSTGLAGGDHLHFGIMVNGVPVNPVEWWDDHWIKDNVERKMALITDR